MASPKVNQQKTSLPRRLGRQVQDLEDTSEDSEQSNHCYKYEKIHEKTFLLRTRAVWKSKCSSRCCIKSKAALLILYWNVSVSILINFYIDKKIFFRPSEFFDPTNNNISKLIFQLDTRKILTPAEFSIAAIFYLFFPLGGCLADIKCGRYKAVIGSLWTAILLLVISVVGVSSYLLIVMYTNLKYNLIFEISSLALTIVMVVALVPSYITFSANVIQFGMDQLHDSPSEDSVIFIHWFVFSSSLGVAITKIPSSFIGPTSWSSHFASTLLALVTTLVLGVSLCLARCKRRWFLVDTGSRNPYKLVYRVIKFAAQHKVPIRRSAFTYCEDELPSRMDLGKDKYGGPFTTEQVEDVKAFLGILSILLTLGPTFINEIAVNRMLPTIARHLQSNISSLNFNYFNIIQVDIMQNFLTATLILLYLCLLRPFIHRWIPGMLKRIGLGMAMLLLSSLVILTIDTLGHIRHSNNVCFFDIDYYKDTDAPQSLNISVYYLWFPYLLNALGNTLFNIAVYELICSQSPHAMKGQLIGTLFTVKGIFQFIGATAVLIPFLSWQSEASFPSCGFVYYLVNVVVAVSGLVAYTWVARRYKYRERDEPDNIYRYAEDYYDRDGDDRYDYSNDEALLNVHTIDN